MLIPVDVWLRTLVPGALSFFIGICLFFCLFLLNPGAAAIWNMIRDDMEFLKKWKRSKYDSDKKKTVLGRCLSFAVALILLIFSGGCLRYGLPLLWEGEENLFRKTGEIENIKSAPVQKLIRHQGTYEPALLRIEGEEYLFVQRDDLHIGDRVTLVSLPSSSVVLACYPEDAFPENLDYGFSLYYAVFRRFTTLSEVLFAAALVLLGHGFSCLKSKSVATGKEGKTGTVWRLKAFAGIEFVLAAALLLAVFGTDLHRGFSLIIEDPRKTVEIEGRVEKGRSPMWRDTYSCEGSPVEAIHVTIAGQRLYLLSTETISEGATVRIRYHPSSGIACECEILSDYEQNSTSAGQESSFFPV